MLDRGFDIVVAEANLRFLGSARFDDDIAVEATVTNVGITSVTTVYRFLRGQAVLLQATVRHVFIDRATAAKTVIPDWARAGLTPWLVDGREQIVAPDPD
jgi:acyl-CoA thioester hydrolase